MFSTHLPSRFTQISRSFAKTDGTAWVVAVISLVTAALVCAAFLGS